VKVFDLEAHFFTRDYLDYLRGREKVPREVMHDNEIMLWYTEAACSPRSFEIDEKILHLNAEKLLNL
jgi:hypothetical protein